MWPEVNITLTTGRGFAWHNAKLWQDADRRAAILYAFWAKVNRTEAKGCWPFLGPLAAGGSGIFRYQTPQGPCHVHAHRLAWVLARGDIPVGQHVQHRCGTSCCVNPSHLFLSTHADVVSQQPVGAISGARHVAHSDGGRP